MKICVENAKPADISAIAELYQSVAITADNVTEKLSKEHPKSFAKCGGIFHIPTDQDIAQMIEKEYMVFLATEASGDKKNLIGYSSCCSDTRNFEKHWCLECAESAKNAEEELWNEKFFKALEASKVAGTYDTIVAEQFRNKGVLWLLNYHLFCALQREHFTHAVFEIYEIIKAEKGNESFPLNLPNVPSLTAHLKMGIKPIGIVKRPVYPIGDWNIWVKANLYAIEVEKALCFLTRKMESLKA